MARFVHKRLARRPGIWRVDGVGPLGANGQFGSRAVVYFSGLKQEGLAQPYWSASRNGLTIALKIHSASLREFKVGSIWENGKRLAGAKLEDYLCHVDAGQAQLVRLDQGIRLNGHWAPTVVPGTNFNVGENRSLLASTFYAILPVLDDPKTHWLVVPTSELLRFYSGLSSRFLSGTLEGRLEAYVDWEKSRMENESVILHVKQRLNRKEAAVLARAVASSTAKAALLEPHKHLASTQANNASQNEHNKRPLGVKAGFPFADDTRLTVFGKRMPLTRKNKEPQQWAIFAMELLECSHSMGFTTVVLESDDPFDKAELHSEQEESTMPPMHTPLFDDDEDEYELEDLPADQRLRRLIVRSYTNQFTAFEDLKFEHRRPQAVGKGNRLGLQMGVNINAFTLEDGSYGKDARGNLGVSDFQNRVAQVDRDLSLFLEMLQYFREATAKRHWNVATRKLNDGLVLNGEQIAVFPEKIGKRHTWHLVVDPDGNRRPRQVVWVELTLGPGQHIYLTEMELKQGESGQCTLMLHKHDFYHLDDSTFRELLVLTAVQNRWPDKHNKWKKPDHYKRAKTLFSLVQIHRINHPAIPKSKEEGRSYGITSAGLNPKLWSAILLNEIDELLSRNGHKSNRTA